MKTQQQQKRKKIKKNGAFIFSNGKKDLLKFRDEHTNELCEITDYRESSQLLNSQWTFSNQPIIIN